MPRLHGLALAALAAACGGAVEQPADDASPPVSMLSSDDAPSGTWDLVSVEQPDKDPTKLDVHDLFEMQLRRDGTATVRRCGKAYLETGAAASLRCADDASYDCYYGTVVKSGSTFTLDIPDLFSSGRAGEGALTRDGGDLVVGYPMGSYRSGRFVRITSDTTSSAVSSSVAACSR